MIPTTKFIMVARRPRQGNTLRRLDSQDLRRLPIEERKGADRAPAQASPALTYKLGCEP